MVCVSGGRDTVDRTGKVALDEASPVAPVAEVPVIDLGNLEGRFWVEADGAAVLLTRFAFGEEGRPIFLGCKGTFWVSMLGRAGGFIRETVVLGALNALR